jgi:membrane-associated phospholipid phosphatase
VRNALLLNAVLLAVLPVSSPPLSAQTIEPSEPGFWIVSGLTLLAAWHLDDNLRREGPIERKGVAGTLAAAGYELPRGRVVVPALASTAALSHLTGWPTEAHRVGHVAAGAAMAGVVTEIIKTTVGRGRPRDLDDSRVFNRFTRDNAWLAFPSGHTVAGFAVAAALDQEFEMGVFGPVAYGIAGLIGWSRLYDDAHWASDTVAGAVVGVVVARSTVAWLQRRGGPAPAVVGLEVHSGQPVLAVRVPVH